MLISIEINGFRLQDIVKGAIGSSWTTQVIPGGDGMEFSIFRYIFCVNNTESIFFKVAIRKQCDIDYFKIITC